MFLWRNKKDISIFRKKKVLYLICCYAKRTVSQFLSPGYSSCFFFYLFFIKAFVVGTHFSHLNCLNLYYKDSHNLYRLSIIKYGHQAVLCFSLKCALIWWVFYYICFSIILKKKISTQYGFCLFVLRFYGPVNPNESCRARSVYLTTHLLGRLSPLRG